MSKSLFKTDEDVLFGAVYIPPDNSKYFRNDLHDLFYEELQKYATENKFIFLLGDFNGRTGAETDILNSDCFVFEQVDIDTADVFHDSLTSVLISNDISLTRVSKDLSTNRVGLNLVDFCKHHEFVINGIAFKDKTIGEFTCKGVSVVDYVLTSCKAIELLCDFEVLEFCPMLSDVHCAVKVNIQCLASEPKASSSIPVAKIKKWQNEMRDLLVTLV